MDIVLENLSAPKIGGASQEIFSTAGEKLDAVDRMLDELYPMLSAADRLLEGTGSVSESQVP